MALHARRFPLQIARMPNEAAPDDPSSLAALRGMLSILIRKVDRVERHVDGEDDRRADMLRTTAQLRTTAKTLTAAALRLQPVSIPMRVAAYVAGGILGGALVQIVYHAAAYAFG